MREEEIKEKFVNAVKLFCTKEERMLRDDVCERALTFRLGLEVVEKFSAFTVYSEYNKAHDTYGIAGAKEIPGKIHTYPDLIVVDGVGQGSDSNILMVEIKKNGSKVGVVSDVKKLEWFTKPSYCYQYKVAAHLFLGKNDFLIVWYKDGQVQSVNFPTARGKRHEMTVSLGYKKYSDITTAIFKNYQITD